uniref:Uncharacterized protein n=1 Tax=Aegilops tauschii subsp. strangulata TaxID=200361 RepID=A0A453LDV5_AEGTS
MLFMLCVSCQSFLCYENMYVFLILVGISSRFCRNFNGPNRAA